MQLLVPYIVDDRIGLIVFAFGGPSRGTLHFFEYAGLLDSDLTVLAIFDETSYEGRPNLFLSSGRACASLL